MAPPPAQFGDIAAYAHNIMEAEDVYNKVFGMGLYHSRDLGFVPTVIDIGAHIGMFTLYIKNKYPHARILAFEPAPQTFETLSKNLDFHFHSDVEVHNVALGSEEGTQTLTHFKLAPYYSTLYEKTWEELCDLMGAGAARQTCDHRDENVSEVDVPVQRLSHFLHNDPSITRIDLLKMNVDGEIDILRGVDDEHWDMLRRVEIKVFSKDPEAPAEIEQFLRSKEFDVLITEDDRDHDIFIIRAIRLDVQNSSWSE
ncbi:methyltransferase FkbM [Aspergillus steynii IBT 23096]|uniref:Methyltransferase FkbM n=1 Tax=Aspergillus steynii IBT 23096 TaxID=1392250 RepID=A0A2I2GA23_9EURO|nr:methyltransferase FkbM [Aspergillus steynii IBT 23096]PLB49731.1 methyltransferase FkbM [Aspergillus steynii IBT 23096]